MDSDRREFSENPGKDAEPSTLFTINPSSSDYNNDVRRSLAEAVTTRKQIRPCVKWRSAHKGAARQTSQEVEKKWSRRERENKERKKKMWKRKAQS